MNTMNTKLTASAALAAAIACADLSREDPRCESVCCRDGYYELTLRTAFLRYEFYVDAVSGQVAGVNFEPVEPESECGENICRLYRMAG